MRGLNLIKCINEFFVVQKKNGSNERFHLYFKLLNTFCTLNAFRRTDSWLFYVFSSFFCYSRFFLCVLFAVSCFCSRLLCSVHFFLFLFLSFLDLFCFFFSRFILRAENGFRSRRSGAQSALGPFCFNSLHRWIKLFMPLLRDCFLRFVPLIYFFALIRSFKFQSPTLEFILQSSINFVMPKCVYRQTRLDVDPE